MLSCRVNRTDVRTVRRVRTFRKKELFAQCVSLVLITVCSIWTVRTVHTGELSNYVIFRDSLLFTLCNLFALCGQIFDKLFGFRAWYKYLIQVKQYLHLGWVYLITNVYFEKFLIENPHLSILSKNSPLSDDNFLPLFQWNLLSGSFSITFFLYSPLPKAIRSW